MNDTVVTDTTEDRVNAKMQQLSNELGSRLDPAPDPIEAARNRASEFVKNISTNTKLELGRRRDELDTAMERITNSEKALTHYIGEFAKFNYEALEHAKVVGKAISELASPFKADPPATITQLKNGKDA